MRFPLIATLATLPAIPAAAETIRLDFSGLVETASAALGVPGTIDSGAAGATGYTATALFDTDVAPGVDIFGRRNFEGALLGLEATFGDLGTVALNQAATASQSPTSAAVAGFFGYGGDAINPEIDALDGTVNGFDAVFGNFSLSPFPGEPEFFADVDDLLSGIEDSLSFDRTSFDTFELSFEPVSGPFRGFIVADIAEGVFSFADGDAGAGGGEGGTGGEEPGMGGGGMDGGGTGGEGGGMGGGEVPAPIPLPASLPLLLTATLGAVLLGHRQKCSIRA